MSVGKKFEAVEVLQGPARDGAVDVWWYDAAWLDLPGRSFDGAPQVARALTATYHHRNASQLYEAASHLCSTTIPPVTSDLASVVGSEDHVSNLLLVDLHFRDPSHLHQAWRAQEPLVSKHTDHPLLFVFIFPMFSFHLEHSISGYLRYNS